MSIVRVDGDNSFKRIDGTSLGGGTFWGLCNLITGVDNFDDMLTLSTKGAAFAALLFLTVRIGDNTHIDLTVGDIYGQDYGKVGLPSHVIASTYVSRTHARRRLTSLDSVR